MKQLHRGLASLAVAVVLSGFPAAVWAETKVAFVYLGPVGDEGWTYQHDVGRKCLEAKGIKTAFVESVPETPDVANVERDFISQGYNVIVAAAFGYQPFTQKVAQENPKTAFLGILPTVAPADNIQNFYGKLWDVRYLSGIVAGKMTKTKKIGFVAARPIPTVIAGLNAFTLGVRSVNPGATVEVVWTLSWYDPSAEKQAAVALVEGGADVVAQHQDTPSAVQGAAEKGAWAIGSDSDMSRFAPQKTLTSTVWNWCPIYLKAVETVEKKSFKAGEVYGGLDDGTVSLAPLNPLVPAEVAGLVEKAKADIISGRLDYWKGPLKTNSGAIAVPEGKTLALSNINAMNWLIEGVVGKIPSKK